MLQGVVNALLLIPTDADDHLRSSDESLFGVPHFVDLAVCKMDAERVERFGAEKI